MEEVLAAANMWIEVKQVDGHLLALILYHFLLVQMKKYIDFFYTNWLRQYRKKIRI